MESHQLINFGKAIVKHALDGFKKVEKEILEKRMRACLSCERLDGESLMCKECGCYITIKANWQSEDCPLNKW